MHMLPRHFSLKQSPTCSINIMISAKVKMTQSNLLSILLPMNESYVL